jgi:tetratricopeptide (TPR) repeat protein
MSDEPTVEEGVRLSESKLWKLQRKFFDDSGVNAWSDRIVPTHVTSNAFIAETYARVAARFIQDCLARPKGSAMAATADQPFYIVEMGSGSGYFGYLFLQKLIELDDRLAFPLARVRYVLTDFTQSNVDFWRAHPCMAPLLEAGLLDVACFDAESDQSIQLQVSGTKLEPGAQANPMVFCGNYLFDTLSHDAFRINRGQLEEGLVSLRARATNGESSTNLLDRLDTDYSYRPILGDIYYGEEVLDGILRRYAAELGDTAFPFPIGGFRCLERLDQLSSGRLLLLSADKGYTSVQQLLDLDNPSVVHHGSVSMMVDYHAMGQWAEARGGFMLANSDRDTTLEIVALGLGSAEPLPETGGAFYDSVERFGPLDVYKLTSEPPDQLDLEQLLTLIRMSGWDPLTFLSMSRLLHPLVAQATASQARRLRLAMNEIWKLYYPLEDGRDLPFELGYLSFGLKRYGEAVYFYEQSLAHHGDHPVTFYNLGLCAYQEGQLRQAQSLFERSLAIDPDYSPARGWRLRVIGELEEGVAVPQVDPPKAGGDGDREPASRAPR